MMTSLLVAFLLFNTNSLLGAQGRNYLPVGKVCRPKNGDGYKIWSGEDTPESCQAKCEADSEKCGAWEFENWAVDDHECELHEKGIILPNQTRDQGECQLPNDGSIDSYRCCWILEDLVQEAASLPAGIPSLPASSNVTNNLAPVSAPVQNYLPVGKVCRPLNDDGYMTWSGEDTPESCRAKCEADADRCGAWEFENWAVDDHECELHEKVIISPEETNEEGECQIPEDGSIEFYRCCWILEDIVRDAETAEGSTFVYGRSSADRWAVVSFIGFASFATMALII